MGENKSKVGKREEQLYQIQRNVKGDRVGSGNRREEIVLGLLGY